MHKNLKYHQAGPSVGIPMESGHDPGCARAMAVSSWRFNRGQSRLRQVVIAGDPLASV
jgi:hypothetical protein